jgi:hypothetical protein
MVYILHFDEPLEHARHYVGSVKGKGLTDVMRRMDEHASGRGARIMAVLAERGIGFRLAGTRPGGRKEERRLKGRGLVCKCPICSPTSRTFSPPPTEIRPGLLAYAQADQPF